MKKLELLASRTKRDLVLANIYFPILVDYAKEYIGLTDVERQSWVVTYSDLIATGAQKHPKSDFAQSAVPITTGRRLGIIRAIIREAKIDCPDLSCLIISRGSGECGNAYQNEFDPIVMRQRILDQNIQAPIDWDEVLKKFEIAIGDLDVNGQSLTEINLQKVRLEMWNYYEANIKDMPENIRDYREAIIQNIVDGFSVKEAFDMVIDLIEVKSNQQPL
jgi:hypothetical protein